MSASAATQRPVVSDGATFYVAATILPEPSVSLLLGLSLAAVGCAGRKTMQ